MLWLSILFFVGIEEHDSVHLITNGRRFIFVFKLSIRKISIRFWTTFTNTMIKLLAHQDRSQKKILTEPMSMNNLWLRQSVHGWFLFLGIRYYKEQKPKKWPRQVPRLACYELRRCSHGLHRLQLLRVKSSSYCWIENEVEWWERAKNAVETRAERWLFPWLFWVLPYFLECFCNLIEILGARFFSFGKCGDKKISWKRSSSCHLWANISVWFGVYIMVETQRLARAFLLGVSYV